MPRTPSQNVIFRGASSGDEPQDPPGLGITVRVRDHLRANGLSVKDEDNWRDSGWSLDVQFPRAIIQVTLARTGDAGQWIARVAALNEPGVVARLLGRPCVSREAEVLAVSRQIHRWLLAEGFAGTLWCVDGFPDAGTGRSEPTPGGEAVAR